MKITVDFHDRNAELIGDLARNAGLPEDTFIALALGRGLGQLHLADDGYGWHEDGPPTRYKPGMLVRVLIADVETDTPKVVTRLVGSEGWSIQNGQVSTSGMFPDDRIILWATPTTDLDDLPAVVGWHPYASMPFTTFVENVTTDRQSPLTLAELQTRALADSIAWFPAVNTTQTGAVAHYLTGLIGELGELISAIIERTDSDDSLTYRLGRHPLWPILENAMRLGAVANHAKKLNRRGEELQAAAVAMNNDFTECPPLVGGRVDAEAADVAIYLFDLVQTLGVDLGESIETKRAELIDRWGNPETI